MKIMLLKKTSLLFAIFFTVSLEAKEPSRVNDFYLSITKLFNKENPVASCLHDVFQQTLKNDEFEFIEFMKLEIGDWGDHPHLGARDLGILTLVRDLKTGEVGSVYFRLEAYQELSPDLYWEEIRSRTPVSNFNYATRKFEDYYEKNYHAKNVGLTLGWTLASLYEYTQWRPLPYINLEKCRGGLSAL